MPKIPPMPNLRNSGWLLYIVGVGGFLEDKPGEWAGPIPHPEEPRG